MWNTTLKEFQLNDNSLEFFPQQLMFPFTLFTFAMQGLKIVMVASMPKNLQGPYIYHQSF